MDIGSITPEEISLSILAEIIQRRRQPTRDAYTPTVSDSSTSSSQSPILQNALQEALDPVCGMTVEITTARFASEYAGTTYYFCAAGCKRSFDKEPEKYVQAESSQM